MKIRNYNIPTIQEFNANGFNSVYKNEDLGIYLYEKL